MTGALSLYEASDWRQAVSNISLGMTEPLNTTTSANTVALYNPDEMTSEANLLQRARKYEEQALVEIYDRFSPGIFRYSLRLLGDANLAEDCVSETFSRLLNSLRQGKGPSQYLQAYLYQIAHHLVMDHYRRQPTNELALDVDQLTTGQEGEPLADGSDITPQRLRSALAALTPDQHQVIVLKYLEQLDNATIAQVVQKSVGSVKSLQHRALSSLRRLLFQDQET
jgi:RNA polymerase sigma-70 factor (ECF subfamily)